MRNSMTVNMVYCVEDNECYAYTSYREAVSKLMSDSKYTISQIKLTGNEPEYVQDVRDNLEAFSKEYNRAVESGSEQFLWRDQYILTRFAQYLLEYVRG